MSEFIIKRRPDCPFCGQRVDQQQRVDKALDILQRTYRDACYTAPELWASKCDEWLDAVKESMKILKPNEKEENV